MAAKLVAVFGTRGVFSDKVVKEIDTTKCTVTFVDGSWAEASENGCSSTSRGPGVVYAGKVTAAEAAEFARKEKDAEGA